MTHFPDDENKNSTNQVFPHMSARREPMFNIPVVIGFFVAAIVGVHLVRVLVLSSEQNFQLILLTSFIPAYFSFPLDTVPYPLARYWSPVSYALLHGDWTHVFVNLLWLIAFGSAVARRFGASRFLLFSMFAALAGAGAHYFMHPFEATPVVGASACVSAYMGAAARFVLGPGGLGAGRPGIHVHAKALSLIQALSNRNVILFVGVWMALNFLFGTGFLPIAGEGVKVAWEAHVGGFVFGLLGFSFFDPKT